jgi:trans-2,3-dihydro-3-hydroxyanthranilate isomerase
MTGNRFYIVDVFSKGKYSGNQLAVVIMTEKIDDAGMQKIAGEFNFSETTFVLSPEKRSGGYDVRIFTPREEVPFAGHPTLGTAYVIRNLLLKSGAGTIALNLPVGQIPVTFESGSRLLWMKQKSPVFGPVHEPVKAAEMIGVGEDDVDRRYPVQEISTGLPFVIIPLKGLKAVKKARTVAGAYDRFFGDAPARPVFIFSPETYSSENHLNARMFADLFGIAEDPATGSAAGCLAGYLVRHRYFGGAEIDIRVEQGFEIRRESILHLKAGETGGDIDVNVGGEVHKIAEGTLY